MRARLVGMLCLLVAAGGLSAAVPARVVAEPTVPLQVRVLYVGSYEYHEKAEAAAGVVSYVNQTLDWDWSAEGTVPVSFNGSRIYGVENLRGQRVVVSGASSGTGADCSYSAAPAASMPIRLSLLDAHGIWQAGYGLGVPGAVATCGGQASSSADVLDCDFNSCDAGVCPEAPPAVSTDRSQTDVLTAFEPTTSYLKTGYVPLDSLHGKALGSSTKNYKLPADTTHVSTVCQPNTTETATISLSSTVIVTMRNSNKLHIDFPKSFPPTPLTDLIALSPDLPSDPSISIPPDSPQLPDYPGLDELSPNLVRKTATSSGSHPVVGIITVRCPSRDRRCGGTISVTATGGAPGGVLGRNTYSVPGGEAQILNVPLVSNAGAVLGRLGHLQVRVSVNSDVMPGSSRSTGHRDVLLTTSPTIPGIP